MEIKEAQKYNWDAKKFDNIPKVFYSTDDYFVSGIATQMNDGIKSMKTILNSMYKINPSFKNHNKIISSRFINPTNNPDKFYFLTDLFWPGSLSVMVNSSCSELALDIILHYAKSGLRCGFISTKTGVSELILEFISRQTHMSTDDRLRAGRLKPEQEELYKIAFEELQDLPIFFYNHVSISEKDLHYQQNYNNILNFIEKNSIDILFINSVENILEEEFKTHTLEQMSLRRSIWELKNFAHNQNIPIIATTHIKTSEAYLSKSDTHIAGLHDEDVDNLFLIGPSNSGPELKLEQLNQDIAIYINGIRLHHTISYYPFQ